MGRVLVELPKVKLFVKNEQREAWAYISLERNKEIVPSQNYINFLKKTLRELDEKLYQDFLTKTYDASGSHLFRQNLELL